MAVRPPITTKDEMYRLLAAGQLGNHIPQWFSLAEWRASGHTGEVGIRAMVPGGQFHDHIPADHVLEICNYLTKTGQRFNISPMFRDADILMCAEVCQAPLLSAFWSPARIHYREALRVAGKMIYGVVANRILRHFLNENSYDDLMGLLEAYPGHAIELTCYNHCCGVLPHRNAIIWEVRQY